MLPRQVYMSTGWLQAIWLGVAYLFAILVVCSVPGRADHLFDHCQQRQHSACTTRDLSVVVNIPGLQGQDTNRLLLHSYCLHKSNSRL